MSILNKPALAMAVGYLLDDSGINVSGLQGCIYVMYIYLYPDLNHHDDPFVYIYAYISRVYIDIPCVYIYAYILFIWWQDSGALGLTYLLLPGVEHISSFLAKIPLAEADWR